MLKFVTDQRDAEIRETDALKSRLVDASKRIKELESAEPIHNANLKLCQDVGDSLRARVEELETALFHISHIAHERSTGPEIPDHYWEIRHLANDVL